MAHQNNFLLNYIKFNYENVPKIFKHLGLMFKNFWDINTITKNKTLVKEK